MSRQFKTVDYEATLKTSVRLEECLPEDHLARFVVDIVAQLDLEPLYAHYGKRGGQPYAPEILLGLLFYAYATGVFSSRKIEQGTTETAAFRYLAGNLSPTTIRLPPFARPSCLNSPASSCKFCRWRRRRASLNSAISVWTEPNSTPTLPKARPSPTNASWKSKPNFRPKWLNFSPLPKPPIAATLRAVPEGMDAPYEIARRQERLKRLAQAKTVLLARAAEKAAFEQADYDAKMQERAAKEEQTGKKPRGKPPTAPDDTPKDGDQYNFTDPDSRIMKNSRDGGFSQQYNAQAAVDQDALLIVGGSLSNHANDQGEVEPTLKTIPLELGRPSAAALDTGYFSEANLNILEAARIDAYIATGRDPHNAGWQAHFAEAGQPPAEGASPREKMAYKLTTAAGKAIYRRRKCTIEPVFGQIKEVMGFRQFSLRGLAAVTGEWLLVCLAYNLRRLHVLTTG